MRFRSSSNSEDLPNFPCAGCYQSYHGNPATWDTVLEAMISVYASAWMFKPFEERSYYGVDQKSFGMGLLVHHHFADEIYGGVAITTNPFETNLDNGPITSMRSMALISWLSICQRGLPPINFFIMSALRATQSFPSLPRISHSPRDGLPS